LPNDKIPWPRVLVEGVVIVGSILLAFGIEAWWDGVQDRGAEEAHLIALDSDLTESVRLMAVSDSGFAVVRSSLLRLVETDLAAQHKDSIAAWAAAGLWGLSEYEPRLSSLADLEASEQLGLLDPEVRRQVSAVKRALEEFRAFQLNLRTVQEGLLDPFLMDEIPIGPALALRLDLSVSIPLPEASEWTRLGSSTWRNRLIAKLRAHSNTSIRRASLLDEFLLLQSLVTARLAELS
jgi:hypothetical protein